MPSGVYKRKKVKARKAKRAKAPKAAAQKKKRGRPPGSGKKATAAKKKTSVVKPKAASSAFLISALNGFHQMIDQRLLGITLALEGSVGTEAAMTIAASAPPENGPEAAPETEPQAQASGAEESPGVQ